MNDSNVSFLKLSGEALQGSRQYGYRPGKADGLCKRDKNCGR